MSHTVAHTMTRNAVFPISAFNQSAPVTRETPCGCHPPHTNTRMSSSSTYTCKLLSSSTPCGAGFAGFPIVIDEGAGSGYGFATEEAFSAAIANVLHPNPSVFADRTHGCPLSPALNASISLVRRRRTLRCELNTVRRCGTRPPSPASTPSTMRSLATGATLPLARPPISTRDRPSCARASARTPSTPMRSCSMPQTATTIHNGSLKRLKTGKRTATPWLPHWRTT
ncbi:hypothetical protein BC830DRAFT_22145 [Chytriomyces sp. MP71]|nr:hypothetical protein BC830DRAFT_22145 [Chytriomyces sp. MP71]